MDIDRQLQLSYYREVADIDGARHIRLVQDTRSKKFFVKKLLTVYNADVYRYLAARPIAHTPRILLVEEDAGTLTVIEEYIPGDTLDELLAARGVMPEGQVLDIAIQLCRILSDFHSCTPPIVNRDIKPANIKLTPDGVVKLVDLNAAKWADAHAPRDTVLLGTQGYAAPEQYGFGPSSVLTDVYSVGVLINELLTGALPNITPAVGRLGPVIRKCVELSPAGRYQSMEALLDALTALAETEQSSPLSRAASFLPPGLRSRNWARWLFALIGYAFVLHMGLTMQLEGAGAAELLLNRVSFTLCALSIILFNGNYLGVQRGFFLTRSPRRWVRWLGMAVIDLGLLALWVVAVNLLSPLLPA